MGQVREEIKVAIEARIAELRPFIAELETLIAILRMVEDPASYSSERTESLAGVLANLAPAVAEPEVAPGRPRVQRIGSRRGRDGRAPSGSNRAKILATISAEPGVTPTEIARLTGIKRTVVSATVTRMKKDGDVEPDGGRGVRIAEAARTPDG